MEIIAHGKDTYEVVDEIPVGYTIWNIGKHAPEGYLPLCRPAREQPFEGARSIDADALKAIKVEGAEEIMKAFGRGEETLDEFEQYVSRNKNSEHCDIKHRVELYERAIPYMKRVKGIEHLTKWEDCTMRTTMRELFVHFYLNEKEICSYIEGDLLNRTLLIKRGTNYLEDVRAASIKYKQSSITEQVVLPNIEPLKVEMSSFGMAIVDCIDPVVRAEQVIETMGVLDTIKKNIYDEMKGEHCDEGSIS